MKKFFCFTGAGILALTSVLFAFCGNPENLSILFAVSCLMLAWVLFEIAERS